MMMSLVIGGTISLMGGDLDPRHIRENFWGNNFPLKLSLLSSYGWKRTPDDDGCHAYSLEHNDLKRIKVLQASSGGVITYIGSHGRAVKVADIRGDEIVWHKYKLEALLDSFLEVKRLAVVHEEAAGAEEGFTMVVG